MIAWTPEDMRAGAAALMLFGPLAGGVASMLASSARLAWGIASLVAAAAAAASVYLALGAGGVVTAPLGVRVDSVTAALAPIVGLTGAVCIIASGWLARGDAGARAAPMAIGLAQVAWFGWTAAAFASDLLTQFAGLQIGALATCGLTALGASRDRAALTAAMQQLVFATGAGIAFALGAACVHAATGAFDLGAIAAAETQAPRLRGVGFALMIGASAVWALAAPLHVWAADALERGARLAGLIGACVGAVAALGVLARLAMAAAAADDSLARGVSMALAALGALSVVIGSAQAAGAQDLRRLAAYAAAAQTGAILIAFALETPAGHAAGIMHMASSALIALGLLAGGALIEGRATMAAVAGFGRRAPIGGAAIAIGALSLIGAPLTLGFLSRWRLIEASLANTWWWAAALMIAAALAAVFYAGRLLERLYAHSDVVQPGRPPWRAALAPAHALAIGGAIALGVNAAELWRAASLAGELLGAPAR